MSIKFLVFVLFFISITGLAIASEVKITSVGNIPAPVTSIGDPNNPDVVLDPSLAGTVNVEISGSGVPDGTKVRVKFKDEENTTSSEGSIQSGMTTVPITLSTGNAKVIYLETDPFIPQTIKSSSNKQLDSDIGTVFLYHLENNILDNSEHNNNLTYYPGWESINYTDGINSASKGIYFWVTPGTYENRRLQNLTPNGTGFTSPPLKWSAEFALKPLRDAPSETWYPFGLQDQNILTWVYLGKSPSSGQDNKFVVRHYDSKCISHDIEIINSTSSNTWSYIGITHDGRTVRLYINGQEKGNVISEGNCGPQPWGNYGVTAGGTFSGNGAKLVLDEIRLSNVARNSEELLNNSNELFGTNLLARKTNNIKSDNNEKNLSFNLQKKRKTKKEIRLEVGATTAPQDGEAKKDDDTVALFHFNGTTTDSVSKKSLVGDPESIDFESGKNEQENSSVSFDGKDDLLLIKKNLFDSGTNEWTIDFFAKPDPSFAPLPNGILTVDNGQIFAMISYVRLQDGKAILSGSSLDSDANPAVIGTETDFPADKWTHIALVYGDKKLKLLINGKSVGEKNLPSLYKKGDGSINVGSDGGDGIFQGQIDELRISDIARSESELEAYAKK